MTWDKEVKLTLAGCLVVVVFALGLMYKRNLDLQEEVDYLRIEARAQDDNREAATWRRS